MSSTPSLSLRLFERIFGLVGNKFKARAFPKTKRQLETRQYPAPARIPARLRKLADVHEQTLHGQTVFTLSPRQNKQPVHLIYLHGGAYVYTLSFAHWLIIQELIHQIGCSMTVPIYPLAPEHTYQRAFSLVEEVYRGVLQAAPDEKIILSGDSAGGGLALAAVMDWRDRGLPLPHRLALFSPWLDITLSNPRAPAAEALDRVLGIPGLVQCGKWWAGGEDPRAPKLSPMFGDLAGLPPVDVFTGTHDLFYPDIMQFREKAAQSGSAVNAHTVAGGMHVYVIATMAPEAQETFRNLAEVLGE